MCVCVNVDMGGCGWMWMGVDGCGCGECSFLLLSPACTLTTLVVGVPLSALQECLDSDMSTPLSKCSLTKESVELPGGKMHTATVGSATFDHKFTSSLTMNNLPQAARLVFTVRCGSKALGWAGCRLVEANNVRCCLVLVNTEGRCVRVFLFCCAMHTSPMVAFHSTCDEVFWTSICGQEAAHVP